MSPFPKLLRFNLYTLSFNFRLKDDNKFSKCLDKLRLGIITDDLCDIVRYAAAMLLPAAYLSKPAPNKASYHPRPL
jgi:hypothetical protein